MSKQCSPELTIGGGSGAPRQTHRHRLSPGGTALHQQHLGVKLPVLLRGSCGVQYRVELRGQAATSSYQATFVERGRL
jgi:hypothetical protein